MKSRKAVLISVLLAISVSALGQGKLSLATDSLHLVYYTTDTSRLAPADFAGGYSGMGVYALRMPAGANLLVDLYTGTDSPSLTLVSTTIFSAVADGRWTALGITFNTPAILPGQTGFFEIEVRDD